MVCEDQLSHNICYIQSHYVWLVSKIQPFSYHVGSIAITTLSEVEVILLNEWHLVEHLQCTDDTKIQSDKRVAERIEVW